MLMLPLVLRGREQTRWRRQMRSTCGPMMAIVSLRLCISPPTGCRCSPAHERHGAARSCSQAGACAGRGRWAGQGGASPPSLWYGRLHWRCWRRAPLLGDGPRAMTHRLSQKWRQRLRGPSIQADLSQTCGRFARQRSIRLAFRTRWWDTDVLCCAVSAGWDDGDGRRCTRHATAASAVACLLLLHF